MEPCGGAPCGLGHALGGVWASIEDGGNCGRRLLAAASFLVRSFSWLHAPCLPNKLAGAQQPPLLRLEGGHESLEALFTVGEKIGQGTYGKVYSCCRRDGSQPERGGDSLCVKVMATSGPHAARLPTAPEAEKAQILKALYSLDHPNIVRYHHWMQTSAELYVVMDRCEGPELGDHAESFRELMPTDSVRSLAAQIFSAIAAVHATGLMHRDVKPGNFRFRDQSASVLQLLDFGNSKPGSRDPMAHSVTGTLLYVAPEVFDGFYAHGCDNWSCGIVLFQLISGQLPFETSDLTMLRSMHRDPVLMGDCLFRGERWHEVPAARGLVRGLLTADPARRLSAAAALAHPWLRGGNEPVTLLEAEGPRLGLKDKLPVDLKRTANAWNLAQCCALDGAEEAPSPCAGSAGPE